MTTVGSYELIGRVAQGHVSTIWKARDPLLDRVVALKELATGADQSVLEQEARVLAALDHPHIVRVYDVVSDADHRYLVEDWVEGASLGAVRDHSGRLTTAQALGVVRGALDGLAYAHHHQVVHGDVAPGNVLIDLDGVSKLIDFGSARLDGAGGTGSEVGADQLLSRGTAGFASPEVAAGRVASARSDVYSAAAVLADLLGAPRPVSAHLPWDLAGLPDRVAAVLAVALSADPIERYPDAGVFLHELEVAAERTLGPGWLTLAGVSGLVSATLGGTGVTLIGAGTIAGGAVAAAAAPPAAEAVAALPMSVAAATAKTSRKWLAGAGVAGAVAVILVAVLLITKNKEPAPTPAALAAVPSTSSPAAPTPATTPALQATQVAVTSTADVATPTPVPSTPTTSAKPAPTKPPTPKPIGFNGKYRITGVVTAVTGSYTQTNKVGQKESNTWTVRSPCTDGKCVATIASTSGNKFKFNRSGPSFTYQGTENVQCVDTVTGKPLGGKVPIATHFALSPTTVGKGAITVMTGESTIRQMKLCLRQTEPLASVTRHFTVTRIGS